MKRAMVAIKVFEMTSSGIYEIFEIETERPLEDEESQQKAINVLTEMAFKNESMYMSLPNGSFVIRGLPRKTIVFQGVFE